MSVHHLKPENYHSIPFDEGEVLKRVAEIDPEECRRLAMAVLGPRPAPDMPLKPVLCTMLLLHESAEILQEAERERRHSLVRAIAESDAIRDHECENEAIRYDSTSK